MMFCDVQIVVVPTFYDYFSTEGKALDVNHVCMIDTTPSVTSYVLFRNNWIIVVELLNEFIAVIDCIVRKNLVNEVVTYE